jgi:Na+-driven multidrug efflux pump
VALAAHLRTRHSVLRPALRGVRLRWVLFRDILVVGLAGSVSTVATNLTIGIGVALAGAFGAAAIAGYGTASRLEYLMVPLVFGFGAPLVAMVGSCIGAGLRERAMRAAFVGALLSFGMTEAIGLWAALFPRTWLTLFSNDPQMLEAGTLYLRTVGPFYGFFGLGLVLYFASQGAGRLKWPVGGNVLRLAVAGLGGWLALRATGSLAAVFAAQAVALVLYGLTNAGAIAAGAWFGPLRWPRRMPMAPAGDVVRDR